MPFGSVVVTTESGVMKLENVTFPVAVIEPEPLMAGDCAKVSVVSAKMESNVLMVREQY